MKLENQVCSLELAKKLKGLGIEQESYFRWQLDRGEFASDNKQVVPKDRLNHIFVDYPAFTATELLEILPKEINSDNNYFMYIYYNTENDFVVKYSDYNNKYIALTEDENLCNALAKMLIYLKENNLI